MDPDTAEQQELERKNLAGEQNVAPEEDDDDEDLDEDEDEDDEDDEDEDDEDEDDDVGTDESGKEIWRTQDARTARRVNEDEPRQAPDVDSDRVPATDAEPEGSLDRVKSAPLGIQQIEDLEDDAKGG